MATMTQERPAGTAATADFDVLIVGAGISGIGAAWHLQHQTPGKSFVVLESKESFGGTWITHTYPGIRSDSDLYTFGYRFKPWVGPPVATAEEIDDYVEIGIGIDEDGEEHEYEECRTDSRDIVDDRFRYVREIYGSSILSL